ncbi:MAG: pyridoxal-phosphate dependent enzyme [Gemmataceae bacterium]
MTDRVLMRCRLCGTTRTPAALHYCEECFGPLEVSVRPPVAGSVTLCHNDSLRRYGPWLPVSPSNGEALFPLALSPLHHAERLGQAWGLRRLYLKDETQQPSGSFKDRLVSVALLQARLFGLDTVICASTGNLARSVAVLAPKLGITAHVLVPEDILAHSGFPAHSLIIAVRGTYDQANRLAIEVAEQRGWGVVNVTLHPFYAEGGKTLGHEIAEQLGTMPRHLVCCMAGGSLLGKIHQGLEEMVAFGLIAPGPIALHGAQAFGCAPIVNAFHAGREEVFPVQKPQTRVYSLAVGDPGDGFFALRRIRATGGTAWAIPDDEAEAAALQCHQLEGIATELAGGVTLAAGRRLAERGILLPEEPVVLVLTGRAHPTGVTTTPHAVIEPTRQAFGLLVP